jgi:hypothetical protein
VKTILPPHLTSVNRVKQCSACGAVFPADVKPSLSKAFRKHVEEVHRKGLVTPLPWAIRMVASGAFYERAELWLDCQRTQFSPFGC